MDQPVGVESTPPQVFLLGLSGIASAGKTLLAHMLSMVYAQTIILHVDDFCKEENQLPVLGPPLNCPDADSAQSINFPAVYSTLDHLKATGKLPDGYSSWYSTIVLTPEQARQQAFTDVGGEKEVERVQRIWDGSFALAPGAEPPALTLVIVDGSLLFHDPEIRKRLDLMVLLRTHKETARARRNRKPGFGLFAKPDEYWKSDMYFEHAVWKNYVKEHSWLFVDGNPEGDVLWRVAFSNKIIPTPAFDFSFNEVSRWTANLTARYMRQKFLTGQTPQP